MWENKKENIEVTVNSSVTAALCGCIFNSTTFTLHLRVSAPLFLVLAGIIYACILYIRSGWLNTFMKCMDNRCHFCWPWDCTKMHYMKTAKGRMVFVFSHDCTDPTPGPICSCCPAEWLIFQAGRRDWSMLCGDRIINGKLPLIRHELCHSRNPSGVGGGGAHCSQIYYYLALIPGFALLHKNKTKQKRDGANISNVFGSEKMRIILTPPTP